MNAMNNLIDLARLVPAPEPALAASFSPVLLPMLGRERPLELRVTAPAHGDALPVVLLSHGHGPSLYLPSKDGYGPLANFLAERGFVVIQPTQANSKVGGLPRDMSGAPLFWRERAEELTAILDGLGDIEAALPFLKGRLDAEQVAAVGHSLGGHTVGMLLGIRVSIEGTEVDMRERRIKAGVLLAAPGAGGDSLSENGKTYGPAFSPDFTHLRTRALVVCGDMDLSPHLTVRGADWHADPYHLSPGAEALLTVAGGKHGLGGIAGYDARETDDEDPDRLELTRRMVWAYLRSALIAGDPAWENACAALAGPAGALGRLDLKVRQAPPR
jgi:predicted dienelactone hydrolase